MKSDGSRTSASRPNPSWPDLTRWAPTDRVKSGRSQVPVRARDGTTGQFRSHLKSLSIWNSLGSGHLHLKPRTRSAIIVQLPGQQRHSSTRRVLALSVLNSARALKYFGERWRNLHRKWPLFTRPSLVSSRQPPTRRLTQREERRTQGLLCRLKCPERCVRSDKYSWD
jgi:hypothetical protein